MNRRDESAGNDQGAGRSAPWQALEADRERFAAGSGVFAAPPHVRGAANKWAGGRRSRVAGSPEDYHTCIIHYSKRTLLSAYMAADQCLS